MGGKSCFCLVEAILISSIVDENAYGLYEDEGSSYTDDDDDDEEGPLITCRYLLRLMTFSLKFDENGDLTTGNSRRVQYYNMSEDATKRVLEHPFVLDVETKPNYGPGVQAGLEVGLPFEDRLNMVGA
jgi:hypothetical protein